MIKKKLMVTSLVVVTGISLHNFPEGMAVYLSTLNGWRLGVTIAIAIGYVCIFHTYRSLNSLHILRLHNFPEGMAVAAPVYAATKSKWTAIKWSLVSGLCEPIGALAFGLFFRNLIDQYGVCCMLAGVSGVMVYICIKELIPSSWELCGIVKMIASNVFGGVVLFFCSLLLAEYEH
jgi:ZIP family zinc transporter